MTRRARLAWSGLALLVLILIALRMALPDWIRDYLNEELDQMGDYHGRIADVDVALWAGAYSLNDVRIVKRTEEIPVPFMAVKRIALSTSWRALLHMELAANAEFFEPVLNFVDDEGSATQSGAGVNWREKLENMAPFRIDEIQVHDGTVHFRNFSSNPPVDLQASQVRGRILNLTNYRDQPDRSAQCILTAEIFNQAPLEVACKVDPFNVLQNFELQLKLTDVELVRLNEFLQAYGNLDAESGEGDFLLELDALDGQLTGYAKPLFGNVSIFSWEQDVEQQGDNPLRVLWEAFWGGVEDLFKNQSSDLIATRVEIRGEIGDVETSTWEAIVGILKNAFIEAYKPQFENLPARDS
jgi:uncharacterized protein YhdP